MKLVNGADLVALHFNPRDMQEHSKQSRTCPTCLVDCSTVALVDLVYTFAVCRCRRGVDYDHLIEQVWHRECYLDLSRSGGSTGEGAE